MMQGGREVVFAYDGGEAVRLAKALKPNVVWACLICLHSPRGAYRERGAAAPRGALPAAGGGGSQSVAPSYVRFQTNLEAGAT